MVRFIVDVDKESGVNTIHRASCTHISMAKGTRLTDGAGEELKFPTVGTCVRYLKDHKINGLIRYCTYCKPIESLTEESTASLGLEITPTGCDVYSLESPLIQLTSEQAEPSPPKTLWERLRKRLLGS